METSYKKSEFVVSEETAKWVRLIKNLHELSNDIYTLVNYDEDNFKKYYPHVSALESLLVVKMGDSVVNNLMEEDCPNNMV